MQELRAFTRGLWDCLTIEASAKSDERKMKLEGTRGINRNENNTDWT